MTALLIGYFIGMFAGILIGWHGGATRTRLAMQRESNMLAESIKQTMEDGRRKAIERLNRPRPS